MQARESLFFLNEIFAWLASFQFFNRSGLEGVMTVEELFCVVTGLPLSPEETDIYDQVCPVANGSTFHSYDHNC
jgi:hypothetical protein